MFIGFTDQIKKGLAGTIAACLITLTISPLLIETTSKPTLVAAEHRVNPYKQEQDNLTLDKVNGAKNSFAVSETNHSQAVIEGTEQRTVQSVSYSPQPTTEKDQGSPVDVYLLARVIHAEGRGEPFEGQVAIGAVLLNRLRDPRFPKTLQQIIFKQGEFCTVRDGQIWLSPNAESIRAAKLAVSGWDPTGGALYFYNPAKTTSRWIWNRPITNHIGKHVFAV